jgi:hypothetical protein
LGVPAPSASSMILCSLCQAEPDVFCHVRDLG